MITDFKNNELFIGDRVIFTMKSYGILLEGTITRITSQITIKVLSYIQGGKDYYRDCIVRDGRQLLKV